MRLAVEDQVRITFWYDFVSVQQLGRKFVFNELSQEAKLCTRTVCLLYLQLSETGPDGSELSVVLNEFFCFSF